MQKLLIVVLLTVFTSAYCLSGTVRGRISDSHSGEVLVGISVQIQELGKTVLSGLDGSYAFKNVPGGSYTLTAHAASYAGFSQKIEVGEAGEPFVLDILLLPQQKSLQEVTVVGRGSGASDIGARQLEKASDNVLNILSNHQLQLMPDVTVASVLRRVSGVTVDRGSDGEGRYPVIRGMDKRYNYTLVNGIKIPSPDDKNRYVPMDIFPSEMLQRLEVIKSLTPDMEGDAIGGVMNLVMKDAPEHLTVSAQGALGYSQMLFNQPFTTYDHGAVNKQSPAEIHGNNYTPTYNDFSTGNLSFNQKHPLPDGQLGFTIGNRVLNKKLGFIFSGSLQSTDRISKDLFFDLSPQPSAIPQGQGSVPDMTDEEHRTYSIHEDRIGLHAKLDYRINPRNRISFYTVFMQLNSYESRMITDSSQTNRDPTLKGTGDVSYLSRSRTDLQSIYNATLQGQHNLSPHFSLDWTAAYSYAGQKMPDRAELTLLNTYDTTGHQGQIAAAYPGPILNNLVRIWQHNSDNDLSGFVNLHYDFSAGEQQFGIGIGGMARHKERSNYYNEYDFVYPSTSDGIVFTNIESAPFTPKNMGTLQSPNSYDATENIEAGYGEIRWKPNNRWNILAGVRLENTLQSYNQYELPSSISTKTGSQSYLDPLPSLQVRYKLNDKAALHLAYFSSISRPGFFEIVPYQFPGEYYTETGNPNLKHSKANNLDLRYELFPGLADQLLVGAFYKRIVDPIEQVYARPATSLSVIEPDNVGTATNYGAELVYTHYFHKFGVSLNYTYTHSDIPTVYKYYYDQPNGQATSVLINKNRPLQGQAAHIGNLSLLYKDPKSGIELQLATIYTGRHITYLSQYAIPDSSFDYWQRGTIIEDFSGEKTLGRHFSVYVKVNNLFNTPDIEEMMYPPTATIKGYFPDAAKRSDRTLVEKKTFGQTYLAGLRYHL
jgi:outer membrane receptor protein involved in Fe transport